MKHFSVVVFILILPLLMAWFPVAPGSGGVSGVDTSGSPEANDIARFTDADTIEGLSYTELIAAVESALEAIATFNPTGTWDMTSATLNMPAFTSGTLTIANTGDLSHGPTTAGQYFNIAAGYDVGITTHTPLLSSYAHATNPYIRLGAASNGITVNDIGSVTLDDGVDITLSDNNYIAFDATPDGMDDGEYNGDVVTGINHGETVAAIKCVFLASDGKVDIADADAMGEFPAIGLSVNGGDDTDAAIILTRGVVRDEDWTGLTVGGAVYLGDDGTGQITQTAPSTGGDCVQWVGVALSDSEIYFNFSGDWYEVAE